MTRETFTQSPLYTISGTGPYPIIHPYRVDTEITATVFSGASVIELDATDFSVSPIGSETTGDVTLTSDIAATYAGASLQIRRLTVPEQGWGGQTAREKGLEAQLDALTQRVQEVDEALTRTIRLPAGPISDLPTERASSWLGFDAESGVLVGAGAVGVPATAFMAMLLDDADAATARGTLDIAADLAGYAALASGPLFTKVGPISITAKAQSSGSGNEDDASIVIDASEDGEATVFFKSDGVTTGYIDLDKATGELRIASINDEIPFYANNALAARVEPAGAVVTDDKAIITKEKGDVRYALSKVGETCTMSDVKLSGTDGGTFTLGAWRTRDLNDEIGSIDGGGLVSEIAYDAQTANFTVGGTLTGSISGETAIIVADTDGGAAGTLKVVNASGPFADNEPLTDDLGGSATSNIPSGVVNTGEFYLPAGTWHLAVSAPAYQCYSHMARIYNVSDAAEEITGVSAYNQSSNEVVDRASIDGPITIATGKFFKIEHQSSASKLTNGFGRAASFGVPERFTTVIPTRIST